MNKKVCLSLKELYNNGIKELHYGGVIHHTTEGNQEYFDLRRKGSIDIVACDGEEFELEIKTSGRVILRSLMTNNSVWLSIEEYNIGVFNIPAKKENKIILITGCNLSDVYYVKKDGRLGSTHYGSAITDFIKEVGLEEQVERLEIHPDILYDRNGCECGLSNKFPTYNEKFCDMPKWIYSKDVDKPLIDQLTDEERIEFDKLNTDF